jgi:CheY-like chemotaxis protein
VLCQSSIAFVKQQAQQKNIQIDERISQNLPDLWVDERRIRQVLINLLNNAVKFTAEGGRITLEVTQFSLDRDSNAATAKNFLRIAVIDTGIGIAPENIHKLFQPFVQIDSALNRKYAGTGLGLSLVKRVVELHGGEVGLTSELGVGSCFMIDLPYISAVSQPDSVIDIPPSNVLLDTAANTSDAPLVLLAEDNEANIATISSYLIAKDYRVVFAKNGQEAIALAKSHHPDLILMDVQMPVMDGLEATRQIRCDPDLINIPIIALTALAMSGDREKCLTAGASEYLTKPVKLKALSQMIQTFLAH